MVTLDSIVHRIQIEQRRRYEKIALQLLDILQKERLSVEQTKQVLEIASQKAERSPLDGYRSNDLYPEDKAIDEFFGRQEDS